MFPFYSPWKHQKTKVSWFLRAYGQKWVKSDFSKFPEYFRERGCDSITLRWSQQMFPEGAIRNYYKKLLVRNLINNNLVLYTKVVTKKKYVFNGYVVKKHR